jgi:hypothetical protein
MSLNSAGCLQNSHPWSSHSLRCLVSPLIAYMESDLIDRARSRGVDLIACRIAYSSPDWLDWEGPGTLRLAFLGLFSPNQTPLPACARESPLLKHEPSVYASISGSVNSMVLGALEVRLGDRGVYAVKMRKQLVKEVSMSNGSRVYVVVLVFGLVLGPTSLGRGFVKNSGGWVVSGFHFSLMELRRVAALSMHLNGCLQVPFVVLFMDVHFVHLQRLLLLWSRGISAVISTASWRELMWCVFRRHLPALLLRVSGFMSGLV